MRTMRNASSIAIAAALAAFTANAALAQDATTPAAPDATVQPVTPTDPAMAPATGTDMGTGDAAQTTPDTTMPSATPDTGVAQTPPAATTGTTVGTDMAATANEPFIQMQQAEQFLGSRLMGADVISAANEDIGDVNDVLFDQDGRAVAILVGIGGFLGIGEKDVAIPFERLTIHRGDENGNNMATLRVGLETTRAELEAAPSFERVDDEAMTGATTEGVTPTDPAAPMAPALPNAGTDMGTGTTPSTTAPAAPQ